MASRITAKARLEGSPCGPASRPASASARSRRGRASWRASVDEGTGALALVLRVDLGQRGPGDLVVDPLGAQLTCQRPRREPRPACFERTSIAAYASSSTRPTSVMRSSTASATSSRQPFCRSLSCNCCRLRGAMASWRRTIWRATSCGSGSPSRWWRSWLRGRPMRWAPARTDPGRSNSGLDGDVELGDVELGDVELGDVAARAASSAALAASCLSFMSSRTRRGPRPPGLPACRPADRPRASP